MNFNSVEIMSHCSPNIVEAMSHCSPEDWVDFLRIQPNAVPANPAYMDKNLYIGDNKGVEINIKEANKTLKYRNIVVLGLLLLDMPGDKSLLEAQNIFILDQPCLEKRKNKFVKTSLKVKTVKSNVFCLFDSTNEFKDAAQYLLSKAFQHSSLSRISPFPYKPLEISEREEAQKAGKTAPKIPSNL